MRGFAWCMCLVVAFGAATLEAQGTNEVGVGVSWLARSGNRDAFDSQVGLGSGGWLERLHLDLRPFVTRFDRFELDVAGFGAEPWQQASIRVDWDRTWTLRLNYNRRESFFALPTGEFGVRRDRWAITRWAGSLEYDNWKPARLRVDIRDVRRSGSTTSPFYGLGLPYVGRTSLDERVQEAGFSVETRTLPVKIFFEQDVAKYVRRNRLEPANNGDAVGAPDPDKLASLTSPGEDSSSVPTSRLGIVYRNDRFEVAAQGLYRRDRLDANRADFTGYALDGGKVGKVGILDQIMGSADTNSKLGDVRLAAAATGFLTFRVHGRYADVQTDTRAIGQRVIQFAGSGGTLGLPFAIDDRGWVNRTDKDLAGEIDVQKGALGLLVAYHDGSREMSWLHGAEYLAAATTRDAKGWNATFSYNPSRAFAFRLGYESSSFERYVVRTDPATVRRLSAKVSVKPAVGIDLQAYVGRDTRTNPSAIAGLDQPTDNAGLAASFSGANGAWGTLSVDWLKFSSDISTRYWAPGPVTGLSAYRSNLLSVGARGALPVSAKVRVEAGALRIEDRADTQPFVSETYDAQVLIPFVSEVEVGVFANQWKYDVKNVKDLDYDVTRYGFTLRRRF